MNGHTAVAEAATAVDTVIKAPYDPAAVRAVRAEVAKAVDDHARADDVITVASELATNSVQHARGRRRYFQVSIKVTEASVYIAVLDDGPRRSSRHAPTPLRLVGGGLLAEGGRGLPIVEALAQRSGAPDEDGRGPYWAELASWMYYAHNGITDRTLTPMQAGEFWAETPEGQRDGDPDVEFRIWALGEFGNRIASTKFTRIPLELP